MEITKYSKSELTQISKLLKKYRSLRKNVGKKSWEITLNSLNWEKKFLVEYFPTFVIKDYENEITDIYRSSFEVDIKDKNIVFQENPSLLGWIRVFYWDDMLDVSFENIRNTLKKI